MIMLPFTAGETLARAACIFVLNLCVHRFRMSLVVSRRLDLFRDKKRV